MLKNMIQFLYVFISKPAYKIQVYNFKFHFKGLFYFITFIFNKYFYKHDIFIHLKLNNITCNRDFIYLYYLKQRRRKNPIFSY